MKTPYDYHSDEAQHGSYQYLTLKEIVNGIHLETMDDDSMIKNTTRYKILEHTKDGIRKLNKKLFDDVRAIEMTVPENLSIALPHNYVDYVRVSRVMYDESTDSYRLKPLNINNNINIADGYLQDNDAAILFDDDGYILLADTSNAYNFAYKKYEFDNSSSHRTKDTSKLSKYGEFVINERLGKLTFSSDMYDKEIVLEYLTDGLAFDTYGEEAIRVHKDGVEPLKDWVFYACIRYKKNIAQVDKDKALLRYKTTLHESKITRANFDLLQVERALRSKSKNS